MKDRSGEAAFALTLPALGDGIAVQRDRASPTIRALASQLLRFAFPATLIMLLSGTSLVVDTYFVAGLGSAALAGATLVLPIYLMLVMAFGGGIGVGISVVLSVRLGRGDMAGAQRAVGSAFALALGFAVILAAAFTLWGRGLFQYITDPGPMREAALSFARPIFLGAPVIAAGLTLSNVLRAEKRLREPAIMLLVSSGVNAALNPVLIHGYLGAPALGVAGASLATVLGFLVSAGLGVFYLRGGRAGPLSLSASALRVDRADILEITRVALPTLGTYAATNGGLLGLSIVWARFGEEPLAAFGLATRLEYLVTIAIYGIGSAILTLGGEARGAGRHRELVQICWVAAGCVALSTSLLAAALMTSPATWFRIFDAPPSVVECGVSYMLVSAPSYPFHALALTLNYGYQTIGRAHLPFYWSLLRGFGIAIPLAAAVAAYGGSVPDAAMAVAASKVVLGVVTAAYLPGALTSTKCRSAAPAST